MNHYDVAIIGSGFVGLATALELCKQGLSVALLDAAGLSAGASSANTSLLLFENTRDATILRMCFDGIAGFETLHEELGRDIGFRELDFLAFLEDAGDLAAAQEQRDFYLSQGVAYDLLSPGETYRLHPLLKPGAVVGAARYTQWAIDPLQAVYAYFARARDLGMDWYPKSAVIGFETQNNRITAALTPGGKISAGHFMVCAGAWTRDILKTVGIALPEYYIQGAAMVLERMSPSPIPTAASPFFGPRLAMEKEAVSRIEAVGWENIQELNANEFVIVPDSHDNLVVAQRSCVTPGMQTRVPVRYLRDMCKNVLRWYPALQHARVVRSWISPVPFTPDTMGFFGRLNPYENLFVSSGYASVLIMLPVLGLMGARLLLGKQQDYDLSAMEANRFAEQGGTTNA